MREVDVLKIREADVCVCVCVFCNFVRTDYFATKIAGVYKHDVLPKARKWPLPREYVY
jgi:hypothetical protein